MDRTFRISRRSIQREFSGLNDKLHPVLERVLAHRGIACMDDLDYRLSRLHPPEGLGQLEQAAARIADAVTRRERTVVVGDFDADGATGSVLLILALRAMGHPDADFVVPNRFDFGYGLSADLVACILDDDAPGLIVTVDNGISSVAGVRRARDAGVSVVVTDHHLPGSALPDADAIVNPNLPGAAFPSKNLAGVGVAFYVAAAVRAELHRRDWFAGRRDVNIGQLLDLVALGTVADVVPLDHNNRVLVSQGLRRIRKAQCRPGIRALLEVAGRDLGRVGATDLAFCVAPRLNAAGRLEDMSIGIRCLLTDDIDEARALAARLDGLNRDRKQIQEDMQLDALDGLSDQPASRVLCLFEDHWHQGIVGLVASRVKERAHRPAIAFAPEEPGSALLKGSARSVDGFHIRDALAAVDASHPGLIRKFGGHAMAAGLSLERDRLSDFQAAVDEVARTRITEAMLAREIVTDGELAAEEICCELARALRDWGPWGQGFPEPQFDGWFEVLERRAIGHAHTKLRVRIPGSSRPVVDALVFNRAPDEMPDRRTLRLVYQLDLNEYMGRISPQLIVRHVQVGDEG